MRWTEAYEHSGNTIAVPVKLIHAIGAKGAILIAQLFYWSGKQQSEEGWIYKTQADLEKETGLSRHEQNTCVEDLKRKKILETRYERLDHRLYYRINRDTLDGIMEADLPSEIRKSDFGKSESRSSGKPKTGDAQILKSDIGNRSETTTENTAENTTTTTKVSSPETAKRSNGADHQVVVAFSAFSTEDERDFFDAVTEKFGLTNRQSDEVSQHPMEFIRDQVRIILSKPRTNLAGCLMDAIAKGGWKEPRSNVPKKSKPRVVAQGELPLTEEQLAKNMAAVATMKATVAGV